jgi:hypothetical protein
LHATLAYRSLEVDEQAIKFYLSQNVLAFKLDVALGLNAVQDKLYITMPSCKPSHVHQHCSANCIWATQADDPMVS